MATAPIRSNITDSRFYNIFPVATAQVTVGDTLEDDLMQDGQTPPLIIDGVATNAAEGNGDAAKDLLGEEASPRTPAHRHHLELVRRWQPRRNS